MHADLRFEDQFFTLAPAWPTSLPGRAGTGRLLRGLLLVLALLAGSLGSARAQVNKFVTRDDANQVPAGTAKSGNVIPNDDNPDNLPNAAFVVTLVAGPTNGTLTSFNADGSYVYTPNPGFQGADSFTYQICQPGATPTCSNTATVQLNVYDAALVCTLGTGPNLLKNPSFTAGNVDFTSSYSYVATPSPPDLPEGRYAVGGNASTFHSAFVGTGRTGPGDNFMLVNGAADGVEVYAQTVTVLPNRYYSFSAYASSIFPISPAQLALVVDGKSTSAVTTLPTNVNQYVLISDLYFSGPGPAAGRAVNIEIRDVNKNLFGNDFGIDDLYFGSCSTFLLADPKTAPLVPNVAVATPLPPLSGRVIAGGSVGVIVASFTVQSLPATGVLTYNGVPVTVGQVIPAAPPGSPASSGGSLAYTPAGGCTAGSQKFTYTATDDEGSGSNNIADYTIPLGPVPAPAIKVQGANPFCEGESISLRAGPRPGFLFTWLRGTTIVNGAGSVLNDSLFVASVAGAYTVRVELAGCAATSTPLSVSTKACSKAEPEPCSLNEKFINTWYFGNKAGLSFNAQAPPATTPAVLLDSQMNAPEGTTTMSDNNGNLLFYSNGDQVWNRNHVVMPNGNGLGGNTSITDGPVAIRRPGSTTRYYLFTQDSEGQAGGLSYSEIDMTLNGGLGDVVAATKNTFLIRRTTEKMTAVLHADGCDSWVIVHGWGDPAVGDEPNWPAAEHRGDAFLAFRVTPTGVVTTPVVSKVGPLHAPSIASLAFNGQMKVSPDGRQLALVRFNNGPVPANGTVELCDFDAATGAVANPRTLDSGGGSYYGVEFSPGLNRLYATILSPPQLLQFDLTAPSIPASKTTIPLQQAAPAGLGSIQAAPDGKLYVSRQGQPELGVITLPDSLGAAAAYVDKGQDLGGRLSGLGLPNFNQSFLVKVGFAAQSTACLVIKFQAGTSIPDPETYAWNFGDPASGANNTSTIPEPSHTFPAPGDYVITLRITKSCLCKEIKATITVPGSPTPGGIAGGQTVCAGVAPAPLTSTAPAGAGTGQFAYQWESSPDGNTWTAVPGANGPGFAPGVLAATTSFRRRVSSGFCAPSVTAAVTVTVLPVLSAGTISADQTVCAGSAAAPLGSAGGAAGGTGTFAYQWESSADNVSFAPIGGATDATFAPGPLTVTTFFRRRVTSGSCAATLSNVVAVQVQPALTTGSIAGDQAICAGSTPAPLSSTAFPTGGTQQYAFQWESSADNVSFAPIAGATIDTYAPGPLSATTYFRRRVSSGVCGPLFSNVITVRVTPAVAAGSIGPEQTLCLGAPAAPLSSTTAPTGGTGTFAFQWESSPNNSTWTPIAGANNAEFTPGPLATTTFFRRRITSGPCGPVFSASVRLLVLPVLAPGSISGAQTICAGSAPAALGSAGGASGGAGTYTYQWESSPDNVSFTPIGGATGEAFAPGALTTTTFFRRRVTSGTGSCATAVSNAVQVQVQPLAATAVSLAAPPVQCAGTALTFTAVATNAGAAPTYRWLVNGTPVASGATFTSSTLVSDDEVQVEVTPTAGLCSTGPATARVVVNRTPTVAPTVRIVGQPDGPVCLGELLTFTISGSTNAGPAPTYQWQVNGADVPGATATTFTSRTLRAGQTVTLRLSTRNVCDQPVTAVSNAVAVRISPPVDVDAGPDKEILAGESVLLEGKADGTYPVVWTPTVGLTFAGSDRLQPQAAPLVTTTYTLSAGSGGCADADQVTVRVLPPIRIPNAFTPNGDGRDDTWQIEFIELFPGSTVSVFNRWGNRIFSADNYGRANEWKGDINGQPAPVGTYYYVVVTKGTLGRSYAGSITVLY